MSTIYTLNGKVLKNAANDKWLAKKEAPAGFVMDASNAIYTQVGTGYYIAWQGPAYPDGYNGNGKQYILVNNNTDVPTYPNPFMYGSSVTSPGPDAISRTDIYVQGTSTGTLEDNMAGGSYGSYFVWPAPLQNMTLEQAQAYIANVTITIVDP